MNLIYWDSCQQILKKLIILCQSNKKFFQRNLSKSAIHSAQKRKLRRGYLGQITRIAKLLERLGEVDTDIKEYLNSILKNFYSNNKTNQMINGINSKKNI